MAHLVGFGSAINLVLRISIVTMKASLMYLDSQIAPMEPVVCTLASLFSEY